MASPIAQGHQGLEFAAPSGATAPLAGKGKTSSVNFHKRTVRALFVPPTGAPGLLLRPRSRRWHDFRTSGFLPWLLASCSATHARGGGMTSGRRVLKTGLPSPPLAVRGRRLLAAPWGNDDVFRGCPNGCWRPRTAVDFHKRTVRALFVPPTGETVLWAHHWLQQGNPELRQSAVVTDKWARILDKAGSQVFAAPWAYDPVSFRGSWPLAPPPPLAAVA